MQDDKENNQEYFNLETKQASHQQKINYKIY